MNRNIAHEMVVAKSLNFSKGTVGSTTLLKVS